MKSILGRSAVAFGFAAIAVVACNKDNDNRAARSPNDEPRAMTELTPEQRANARGEAARSERSDQQKSIGGGPSDTVRTTPALALASIATARCDRELRCKNIGPNEKYLSTSECVSKLQNDKRSDINAQECPGGISDKALTSCLQAVREEDCNNPLDAISRLTACRTGNLCIEKR
jgi:Family of unknown function (DUF6184)